MRDDIKIQSSVVISSGTLKEATISLDKENGSVHLQQGGTSIWVDASALNAALLLLKDLP